MKRNVKNALIVLAIGALITIFLVPDELKFESGFITFIVSLFAAT